MYDMATNHHLVHIGSSMYLCCTWQCMEKCAKPYPIDMDGGQWQQRIHHEAFIAHCCTRDIVVVDDAKKSLQATYHPPPPPLTTVHLSLPAPDYSVSDHIYLFLAGLLANHPTECLLSCCCCCCYYLLLADNNL